ncbi:extracellular solute-binding protein [Halocatena marina]|uniref:extracellular solute-binding protein n=1 Tax=Halocatena marina TaxID=2934937 RepID=UPI00222534F5|nr:extracellular solute-binding protein [Halocatena marina]
MSYGSKRRTFLKAAGVGLLGGLAGCTRGAEQKTPADSETSSSGESKTVSIPLKEYAKANIKWTKYDGDSINIGAVKHPWVDAIKPAVPVFEELTGINVKWNILPEQEFRTKRLTDVSTGAGKFDVFFMDQVVNQFRQSGWIQPLDPYFDSGELFDESWYQPNDLLGVCREAAHGAGRADMWTGMPITVEVLTTFYRKDLYKKHDLSIPKTFADLRANAKIIHENENGVVGGVARGQKGYGMNIYIQNAWIRAFGKKLWNTYPSDSALDSEPAIAAGKSYINLLQNYGPAGAASQTWSDALSTMQSGKAGHIFADANLFWDGLTDPEASSVSDSIGITKMPVPDTSGGRFAPNAFTWQISTSKNAKNSEAGFLFMLWATSTPTMNWMHVKNGAPFPVRESTWLNKDFKKQVRAKYAEVSLHSLKNAIGDPFDPKYPEWGQKYSEKLQTAIAGNQSVEKAFRSAAKQAEQIATTG